MSWVLIHRVVLPLAVLCAPEFYGFMSWVLVQRPTLPLAVFFRFHSAVVTIELWKEVYASKVEENTTEIPQITTNKGDVQSCAL